MIFIRIALVRGLAAVADAAMMLGGTLVAVAVNTATTCIQQMLHVVQQSCHVYSVL